MAVLILAMIAKDTVPIENASYLRLGAQAICLIAALVSLPGLASIQLITRYWPFAMYIAVAYLGALFSSNVPYTLLQVTSLAAVIGFGVAYFESEQSNQDAGLNPVLTATFIGYGLACFASAVMAVFDHPAGYGEVGEYTFIPDIRFHGAFPTSAKLAEAGGILAGLALISAHRLALLKWPLIIVGVIGLAFTLSRTYWVAFVIAAFVTLWLFRPDLRIRVYVAGFFGVLFALLLNSGVINTKGASEQATSVLRVDSISHLTGRLDLWERALTHTNDRLLLGHGLTQGADAIWRKDSKALLPYVTSKSTSYSPSRPTVHNGYLQSLLDVGLLGSLFYLAIFFLAIRRSAGDTKHPEIFFLLVFMAISNLGESAIYSASVCSATLFWLAAVFALSRRARPTAPAPS